MATLFVIGTPIGNLEDITLRALRVLKEVDLVLCEDTRMTARLFSKYDIATPKMSYHAQSKLSKSDKILALLEEGKNLALVSDAGTPCISDPGSLLLAQVREKFGDAVVIVPIPGPSALITALSAAGISVAEFTFLGFLPHKKGRETLFKEIAASSRVMAFYESPHRIEKALESLEKFCGADRGVIVARELTKIHEEFVRGTATEVRAHFTQNPDRVRGEFVVIVEGRI
ncbi:MAG: 16S rRNA (cytidine(1402)-2'-O)-methyltransferase [Candidatus Yonathbacteria bacterium RIFOXYC2_FULL_47_9]|nr:MAG: 16S rRNA (cytidine(1402)-2'-O)-methyltransferase [Candidatus Yonathbacteria bacterium RIFOXYC2_FULL_47_9]HAT68850.1 16S rRNA (cytidine(1402)-2'-O)-methyltransferase [Candidatus Yonathbacteria bacterium]